MLRHLQPETAKWILPFVATIFFGLIGALFTLARDWSISARKARLLDLSVKRVDFWAKWLDTAKAHNIAITDEQHAFAYSDLSRTADVVHGELRFWPLPQTWTPQAYRARWKLLSPARRALMFYRQQDRMAQWLRLAWYAYALGLLAGLLYSIYCPDPRPDSTLVPYFTPGLLPPPDITDPQLMTTLGVLRQNASFDLWFLILFFFAFRLVIFVREWRWMTPLREDPDWLRKARINTLVEFAVKDEEQLTAALSGFNGREEELEEEIKWFVQNQRQT